MEQQTNRRKSMLWLLFALGAVLSWGMYGPTLHQGQVALGNPLRALLCVGVAYFLIAILVPLGSLSASGELSGFTRQGATIATIAGGLGALGAVCIIYAFRAGGSPNLCHARRLRRSPPGKRGCLDVAPSTRDCAESAPLLRLRPGGRRRWPGPLLQTPRLRK